MSLQKFKTILRYFKIFALTVFFLIKCDFLSAQKELTDSAITYEDSSKRGVDTLVNTNDSIPTIGGTNQTLENYFENSWFILTLTGLLSFLMGGVLVSFYIKARIIFILGDDAKTYRDISNTSGLFSFLSMVRLLKNRKDEYKNNVIGLNKEIKQIEKKAQHTNNTIVKTIGNSFEDETQPRRVEKTSKSVESNLSKEVGNRTSLFFSIPENDGSFIIDKGEQTNDGSRYYNIEYRYNSDEGILIYICGTQDKRAINRLDSYLKPVCDIDNIINADNAGKIELLMPGKVIKIGNSWVIDPAHKVKIKLV